MKKRAFLGGLIVMALFLSACNLSTSSSSESSVSSDTTSGNISTVSGGAPSKENSVPDSILDSTSSQSSDISSNGLVFYESLLDVPWATIEYTNEKNGLSKDGAAWYDAPSNQKIGEIAFSNGQFLFVQIFFPTGEYRWCAIQYSSNPAYSYFLPSQADNKMFVKADGDLLLLSNGDGFNTKTLQWIADGTVVENAEIY